MKKQQKIMRKALPNHIAIILDGNGRWAKRRGLPRSMGHYHGALNLKNITLVAYELGIKVLSVYAFSTENWSRPKDEIEYLMGLPKNLEETFKAAFEDKDYAIRVMFSGRRDRLPKDVLDLMVSLEENTKHHTRMILNVCVDYGSHNELIEATKKICKQVENQTLAVETIDEVTIQNHLYTKALPPVDLLIRTSGEQRLSNFLLWQVAYAEFYFTKVHWPAFKEKQFLQAIENYQNRQRKFGGLKE